MNTRNAEMQKVAGARILAKASTLYTDTDTAEYAWNVYNELANNYTHRYGVSLSDFAIELKIATFEIYNFELKTEIFGYSINEVAA